MKTQMDAAHVPTSTGAVAEVSTRERYLSPDEAAEYLNVGGFHPSDGVGAVSPALPVGEVHPLRPGGPRRVRRGQGAAVWARPDAGYTSVATESEA